MTFSRIWEPHLWIVIIRNYHTFCGSKELKFHRRFAPSYKTISNYEGMSSLFFFPISYIEGHLNCNVNSEWIVWQVVLSSLTWGLNYWLSWEHLCNRLLGYLEEWDFIVSLQSLQQTVLMCMTFWFNAYSIRKVSFTSVFHPWIG